MDIVSFPPISELEGNRTAPLSKAFLSGKYHASWSMFSLALFDQIHWRSWFWGSGGVMFLIALVQFYREEKVKEYRRLTMLRKINGLEQKALRSQMNPHFIFNALNSIQSFIVDGDKKSSVVYLAKFSRLIRSTLHLSNYSSISLTDELEMLTNYLELERLRFTGSFKYNLIVDPNLDQEKTMLPPMLIQPILENAILHGISSVKEEGVITVHFKPIKSALLVSIRDNGIGINTSKKLKEKCGKEYRSVGLQITQKRLQLLSGIRNGNKFRVKEYLGQHGEVLGTEVQMRIPQKNADDNVENYFYPALVNKYKLS